MAQIVSVIKVRLAPDEYTARCLDDQSRKCNSLYNMLLEQANHLKQEFKSTGNLGHAKILYSQHGLRNLVPSIKNEHPYFRSVYAAPLKNTALRLTNSIKAHQDSRKGKRPDKIGWPRFRAWKISWFSLLYDEPNKGYTIKANYLLLSLGMGINRKRNSLTISMIDAHVLEGKEIRNLRIIKEGNIFSAVFTIKRTVPKTRPIKKIIAFDPNHKNLAYGVDNEGMALEIQAPYWLKIFDVRLDELKSKLDRCKQQSRLAKFIDEKGIVHQRWKTSRRYIKLRKTYDTALAKRRELTKLFCYRTANILCKQYDLIAVGDYAPNGQGLTTSMRRAMNNHSLIGRFKEVMAWVALKSGKTYQEFPEKGTTRTCHACGFIMQNGLAPSIRQWTCPGCALEHIRDENAACNGLKKILRNLHKESEEFSSPVPSSGHVLIKERWAWRVLSSGAITRHGGKAADSSAPTRN